MTLFSGLFSGLLADAGMLDVDSPPADVLRRHHDHRSAWYAASVGPLVVPDTRLAEVGQLVTRNTEPVEVTVVNTGGAGGLTALARRSVPGVQVVAVESALRDLDDLAGNAARVVAAAAELDESVEVFVELPEAPGWVRAVEVVEAAGLYAKLRDPSADQLSVLVEADLGFTVAGSARDLVAVLMALDALIDGADVAAADTLLRTTDRDRMSAGLDAWDEGSQRRIRRRLRRWHCPAIADQIEELTAVGVLARPISGS